MSHGSVILGASPAIEYESREHACGFDRSELYSDEGPPIGAAAVEPWAEAALALRAWLLRRN
jgi:hypothetical protein